MISMIAAQGANRELGYKGQIPWQLPEDQENFKKLTKGHTIIMGRLTFQSRKNSCDSDPRSFFSQGASSRQDPA